MTPSDSPDISPEQEPAFNSSDTSITQALAPDSLYHPPAQEQTPPDKKRFVICLFYAFYPVIYFFTNYIFNYLKIEMNFSSFEFYITTILGIIALWEGIKLFFDFYNKVAWATISGCLLVGALLLPVGALLYVGLLVLPEAVLPALSFLILPWVGIIGLWRSRNQISWVVGFILFMIYAIFLLQFLAWLR